MGALKDIWNSERGLLNSAALIAITVLAAIGRMPIDMYQVTLLGILGLYTVTKTASGIVERLKGAPNATTPTTETDDKTKTETSTSPTPVTP